MRARDWQLLTARTLAAARAEQLRLRHTEPDAPVWCDRCQRGHSPGEH